MKKRIAFDYLLFDVRGGGTHQIGKNNGADVRNSYWTQVSVRSVQGSQSQFKTF